MSSPDSFGYRRAYVDHPQLLTPLDLVAERYGICDHDLAKTAIVEGVDSIPTQNAVRNYSDDFARTVVFNGGCSFAIDCINTRFCTLGGEGDECLR